MQRFNLITLPPSLLIIALALMILGCATEPIPRSDYIFSPEKLPLAAADNKIDVISTTSHSKVFIDLMELYPAVDSSIIEYLKQAGYDAAFRPSGRSIYITEKARTDYDPAKMEIHDTLMKKNMEKTTDARAELTVVPIITMTSVELAYPYSYHKWAGVKRKLLMKNTQRSGWISNRIITLQINVYNKKNELVFSGAGGLALAMKVVDEQINSLETRSGLNPIEFRDIPPEYITEAIQLGFDPFVPIQ